MIMVLSLDSGLCDGDVGPGALWSGERHEFTSWESAWYFSLGTCSTRGTVSVDVYDHV